MKVDQFQNGKPCCGGNAGSRTFILGGTVSKAMLAAILNTGLFVEVEYQTKAGILYVENKHLVISGPFGRNRLTVNCKFAVPAKTEECNQQITGLIALLEAMS